jgi:hypothetical protein
MFRPSCFVFVFNSLQTSLLPLLLLLRHLSSCSTSPCSLSLQPKRFPSSADPNMKFRSWVVSSLNQGKLHEFLLVSGMGTLPGNFFSEEAILRNENALQAAAHALKPLSKLPFQLDVEFELHPPKVSQTEKEKRKWVEEALLFYITFSLFFLISLLQGPIKASSQLLSCTWMTTGDEGGHQAWYYCYNCATPDNTPMKCCVNCIVMCHSGHQITFAEVLLLLLLLVLVLLHPLQT